MSTLLNGSSTVTLIIMAVCIGVSLPGFWMLREPNYRDYILFIPYRVKRGDNLIGAVLSHFAHGDLGHLFVNMLTLYFFGPAVERELGPVRYLILYLVSGLVGSLVVLIFRRNNPKHSALGASGCVAGVIFAEVVISPTSTFSLMFLPIPIPAPIFAVIYLALSSYLMGRGDRVAHEAHIGGAIAGFLLAGLLADGGFGPLVRTVSGFFG